MLGICAAPLKVNFTLPAGAGAAAQAEQGTGNLCNLCLMRTLLLLQLSHRLQVLEQMQRQGKARAKLCNLCLLHTLLLQLSHRLQVLEQMHRQGKARAIGVSNYSFSTVAPRIKGITHCIACRCLSSCTGRARRAP
jgi:hypothetical protein